MTHFKLHICFDFITGDFLNRSNVLINRKTNHDFDGQSLNDYSNYSEWKNP